MHFCREKWDFETGGGKNPNFNEMMRADEKRRFGAYMGECCRNRGDMGEKKGLFARFEYQNTQKRNVSFVSKLTSLGGSAP